MRLQAVVGSAVTTESLQGLRGANREKIESLRSDGRFFWVDASLREQLAPYTPEGRSDPHVVYAVLEAMIASAFDALDEVEVKLDEVGVTSSGPQGGRIRMATLRAMTSRLSRMRRQAGPERGVFARIGAELGQLEGLEADTERFGGIGEQLNRLVDAIDAAAGAVATQIGLRQNETIYWLTVVATIFLPLTFLTGFFGMNFGWMVQRIDTHSRSGFSASAAWF